MYSIKISNLAKHFGEKQVLYDLSVELNSGGLYLIVGKNGVGKTTLLKCILGLYHSSPQSISLSGSAFGAFNPYALIGAMSGLDNIRYFIPNFDLEQHQSLVAAFDMKHCIENKVADYSLGMRQKLSIMITLLRNPDILIFDEPLVGLDQAAITSFGHLIEACLQQGKTILIASHQYANWFQNASKVFHLKDGHLNETQLLLQQTYAISFEKQEDVAVALEKLDAFSPLLLNGNTISIHSKDSLSSALDLLHGLPIQQIQKKEGLLYEDEAPAEG